MQTHTHTQVVTELMEITERFVVQHWGRVEAALKLALDVSRLASTVLGFGSRIDANGAAVQAAMKRFVIAALSFDGLDGMKFDLLMQCIALLHHCLYADNASNKDRASRSRLVSSLSLCTSLLASMQLSVWLQCFVFWICLSSRKYCNCRPMLQVLLLPRLLRVLLLPRRPRRRKQPT